VFFDKKVDLVLANVPFNLLIPHVFKSLSLIPSWNMWMDNFIKSIVVFANKFQFDRRDFIIMHVNDPWRLKEILFFLESYQLKVHMKRIVVNSSP
jgi:hypothetical protein